MVLRNLIGCMICYGHAKRQQGYAFQKCVFSLIVNINFDMEIVTFKRYICISYIQVQVCNLSYYLSLRRSRGQGLITKITKVYWDILAYILVNTLTFWLVFLDNSYTFVWEQHC